MKIKCIACVVNAGGEGDLVPVVVDCTQDQYECGDHYDAVKDYLYDHGDYDVKLVIDENESGFRYIGGVDWSDTASCFAPYTAIELE